MDVAANFVSKDFTKNVYSSKETSLGRTAACGINVKHPKVYLHKSFYSKDLAYPHVIFLQCYSTEKNTIWTPRRVIQSLSAFVNLYNASRDVAPREEGE